MAKRNHFSVCHVMPNHLHDHFMSCCLISKQREHNLSSLLRSISRVHVGRLAGSSQSRPFSTLLVFFVAGLYTYIPWFVMVKFGTPYLSATRLSCCVGLGSLLFG